MLLLDLRNVLNSCQQQPCFYKLLDNLTLSRPQIEIYYELNFGLVPQSSWFVILDKAQLKDKLVCFHFNFNLFEPLIQQLSVHVKSQKLLVLNKDTAQSFSLNHYQSVTDTNYKYLHFFLKDLLLLWEAAQTFHLRIYRVQQMQCLKVSTVEGQEIRILPKRICILVSN